MLKERARPDRDTMNEEQRLFATLASGDAVALNDVVARNPQLAEARDEQGLSAVMVAQYQRRPDLVAVLLGAEPNLEIFEAAALGMTQRVRRFLWERAHLAEAHSVDGYTPLHLACQFGHEETVRELLSRGVRVNTPANNATQATPLHVAVAGRWRYIAEVLLERGAAVDARQQAGFTPLHLAVQNRDEMTARVLVRHGADPHAAAADGRSPLDLAREAGNASMVRILGG